MWRWTNRVPHDRSRGESREDQSRLSSCTCGGSSLKKPPAKSEGQKGSMGLCVVSRSIRRTLGTGKHDQGSWSIKENRLWNPGGRHIFGRAIASEEPKACTLYSSLILNNEGDDLSKNDLLWSSHGALSTSLSSFSDLCPTDFRGQVWLLAGS